MSEATSSGTGWVFSFTFSATGTASCGAPYGSRPTRSARRGRSASEVIPAILAEGGIAAPSSSAGDGRGQREPLPRPDGRPGQPVRALELRDDVARVGSGCDAAGDGPERVPRADDDRARRSRGLRLGEG